MYKYHTQEINIRICVYLRQAFMRECFVTKSCRFDVLNQCEKKGINVRACACVCAVCLLLDCVWAVTVRLLADRHVILVRDTQRDR